MPTAAGGYTLAAHFPDAPGEAAFTAAVTATPSKRKGVIRVDPAHPYHFIWAGTGDHYFLNGVTAYWLLGNRVDADIEAALDRLAAHKITRVRVALNGRTTGGERWYEPNVRSDARFRFNLQPWVAARPADVANPGLDTGRFDVGYWQKVDRLLRHARELDLAVSLIFHLDGQDPGVDPFGGGKKYPLGDPERAYYRYAAARCGAFSNVMWDITNEWHLFRDETWVRGVAAVLKAADPYGHPASVHGRDSFPFRADAWADFCEYQAWDIDNGGKHMARMRAEQAKTGKPKPQVNEEYGYENHYPGKWGGAKVPPARDADSRRRVAWAITMAGGYQTTGERADTGAGGWLTGRGDGSMKLLDLHAHLTTFFTGFDWWAFDPAAGVAGPADFVLADGKGSYVVYAPAGGTVKLTLPPGDYAAAVFDPRTGTRTPAEPLTGGAVTFPDGQDWVAVVARPRR